MLSFIHRKYLLIRTVFGGVVVVETSTSVLQVAAMQGMILVQQRMLSIGSLISC